MASGIYASPNDLLLAGVKLLHQKRLAYEELKNDVQHAIAQANSGDYIELDQAGLRQFFDDLKSKAMQAGTQSVTE